MSTQKLLANAVCSLCQRMLRDCWMKVFGHLKSDEIVTALFASRDLIAYVQSSIYCTITWEWNIVPRANILRLLPAVLLCPELALNIQHVSIIISALESYYIFGHFSWYYVNSFAIWSGTPKAELRCQRWGTALGMAKHSSQLSIHPFWWLFLSA